MLRGSTYHTPNTSSTPPASETHPHTRVWLALRARLAQAPGGAEGAGGCSLDWAGGAISTRGIIKQVATHRFHNPRLFARGISDPQERLGNGTEHGSDTGSFQPKRARTFSEDGGGRGGPGMTARCPAPSPLLHAGGREKRREGNAAGTGPHRGRGTAHGEAVGGAVGSAGAGEGVRGTPGHRASMAGAGSPTALCRLPSAAMCPLFPPNPQRTRLVAQGCRESGRPVPPVPPTH